MQLIIGFVIVFGSIVYGYTHASGRMLALWQPAEFVIILGAGFGAMVISNPPYVLKNYPNPFKDDVWERLRRIFL